MLLVIGGKRAENWENKPTNHKMATWYHVTVLFWHFLLPRYILLSKSCTWQVVKTCQLCLRLFRQPCYRIPTLQIYFWLHSATKMLNCSLCLDKSYKSLSINVIISKEGVRLIPPWPVSPPPLCHGIHRDNNQKLSHSGGACVGSRSIRGHASWEEMVWCPHIFSATVEMWNRMSIGC